MNKKCFIHGQSCVPRGCECPSMDIPCEECRYTNDCPADCNSCKAVTVAFKADLFVIRRSMERRRLEFNLRLTAIEHKYGLDL